jgi:hypothetical protein
MQQLKEIIRRTGVSRLLWLRKAATVRRYGKSPQRHLGYVMFDPELDNFTYDIENVAELDAWLDDQCGSGAGRFVYELSGNEELHAELASRFRWRPWARFQPFGRRLGWYAIVRATKPKLVVETGTHDGLGSVALLAALARNTEEGHAGRLVTIDPRERTGWLIPERLRRNLTLIRASSYDAFPECLDDTPDIFIHDSLHTVDCERWELERAVRAGARFLLSDNSHATSVLRDVAAHHGFTYSFWQEKPEGHWYPGGGIGLAVAPARSSAMKASRPTGSLLEDRHTATDRRST